MELIILHHCLKCTDLHFLLSGPGAGAGGGGAYQSNIKMAAAPVALKYCSFNVRTVKCYASATAWRRPKAMFRSLRALCNVRSDGIQTCVMGGAEHCSR